MEHRVWRLYYPAHSQIQDPTPELPPALVRKINAIETRAVAYLRTTENNELEQAKRFIEAAVEIFGLLSQGRLEAPHGDVEPLRQLLRSDAEAALRVAHWMYKLARSGGRMPYCDWHEGIECRLYDQAERIVTRWWARQAECLLTPPTTPAPVPTRAPRTETARCIEAFFYQVEEKTGIKVDKTEFWLRPTKSDGTPRYSSDREFRAYQSEDPSCSQGVVKVFNSVLRMTPERFVEGREERRQWLQAKHNKNIRR
jgi:hypothetical protein